MKKFIIFLLLYSFSINRVQSESIEFVYFDANIGQSSGGHSALKLGELSYHFQFFPDGIFHLVREPWKELRYNYNSIDNRNIEIQNIQISPNNFTLIKDHYDEIYLIQKKELETLEYLKFDREIFESLPEGKISVPTLGYFPVIDAGREEFKHINFPSTLLPIFLKLEEELNSNIYPTNVGSVQIFRNEESFSFRLLNSISLKIFLYHYFNDSPLTPGSVIESDTLISDVSKDLLLKAWKKYLPILEKSLEVKVNNGQLINGKNLLIELARIQAIKKSIQENKIYFLDVFPGNYTYIEKDKLNADQNQTFIRNQVQRIFQSSLEKYLKSNEYSDRNQMLLEDSFNRLNEFYKNSEILRTSFTKMLPSRPGIYQLNKNLLTQISGIDKNISSNRYEKYLQFLQNKYAFNLFTKNLTTEIFHNLPYESSENIYSLEKDLGAKITGKEFLVFIPFFASNYVKDHSRSTYTIHILSFRRRYSNHTGGRSFLGKIKESNTLSSEIYRFNDSDHFFIFFTDDQILLRPFLGMVNLTAGIGQMSLGLFTGFFDNGKNLTKGLEGSLFSLPELFFFNIRKGKFLNEEEFLNIFLSEKNEN